MERRSYFLDNDKIPDIEVKKVRGSTWYLYIDGKLKNLTGWSTCKIAVSRYLLRTYGIELRTDPLIRRNYVEKTQKIVQRHNDITLLINQPLDKYLQISKNK